MKNKPYYQVEDPSAWTAEQQAQSVEHAMEITFNYTRKSLEATGGHAMPLAMILFRQSVALMLKSGWTAEQINQYCWESTTKLSGADVQQGSVIVGTAPDLGITIGSQP